MPCKGCGRAFEDGDCVLVQPDAKYHYIPNDLARKGDTIFFDCFMRSLGIPTDKDRIGVYWDRNIDYMVSLDLLTLNLTSSAYCARID